MWQWVSDFATSTMPTVDNIRKLIWWTAGFSMVSFTLGAALENYTTTHLEQRSATVAAPTSGSKTCDVLSEVSLVQSTYGTQIEPIQARWLELTKKLERGDMLNSERDKVAETAELAVCRTLAGFSCRIVG